MSTSEPADEVVKLVDDAFNAAKESFRKQLDNTKQYKEILESTTTIGDVYGLALQLQENVASSSRLRSFRRVRPFLEILAGFQGIIENFVQVKPEILALLWGPVKLLLKLSSELASILDSVAQAMSKIAQALSQFSDIANVFPKEERVQLALVLFYEDILDFYCVMLRIFRSPGRFTSRGHAASRLVGLRQS